jgi:hypothetical protein
VSCKYNISNNPPAINAGIDYIIPNGTAFILKGTGSDQKGILSAIPGSKMIVQ